jgi:hypothetical protein
MIFTFSPLCLNAFTILHHYDFTPLGLLVFLIILRILAMFIQQFIIFNKESQFIDSAVFVITCIQSNLPNLKTNYSVI